MSTAEKLLDAAETRMRAGGFHAVSFRDLAQDLSIKSASVHYYYRHKEDLGAAVVSRYRDVFLSGLNAALGSADGADARLSVVCSAFRAALAERDQICLCGVMGAETRGLPDKVRAEVARFLRDVSDWIAAGFAADGAEDGPSRALTTLSALEGGMILAVTLEDPGILDSVADQIKAQFSPRRT